MNVSISVVGDCCPTVYRKISCTDQYLYTCVPIWTSKRGNNRYLLQSCDKTETAISLIKAIVNKSSNLYVFLFYYEVGRCGNCVGENSV